jgi:hypothetical protein
MGSLFAAVVCLIQLKTADSRTPDSKTADSKTGSGITVGESADFRDDASEKVRDEPSRAASLLQEVFAQATALGNSGTTSTASALRLFWFPTSYEFSSDV